MSVFNTTVAEITPSVREASAALLAQVERSIMTEQGSATELADAMSVLGDALAQPERSRPGVLPDVDLAILAIDKMKRNQPISSEDVRVVVELAGEGVEQLRQFDVRWNADMRAIKRWQAGDDLPTMHRLVLERARDELRGAASHYADHPDGMGQAYREASQVVADIEEALSHSDPEARSLVWPDHADLVVWLMELIDRPVEGFDMAEVTDAIARLEREAASYKEFDGSGLGELERETAALIAKMAAALIATDRRAFIAETQLQGRKDWLGPFTAPVAENSIPLNIVAESGVWVKPLGAEHEGYRDPLPGLAPESTVTKGAYHRLLLTEAARLFREYEAHHIAKMAAIEARNPNDPEKWGAQYGSTKAKAERNANIAGRIEAALSLEPGQRPAVVGIDLATKPSVHHEFLMLPNGRAGLVELITDAFRADLGYPPTDIAEELVAKIMGDPAEGSA